MSWQSGRSRSDVFSVVFWMYVVARCFGYWPFSVNRRSKSRCSQIRITRIDLAWFVGAIILHTLFHWLAVMGQAIDENQSYAEMTTEQIFKISGLVVTVMSIVMDMRNRHLLWDIILKFNKFDEQARCVLFILTPH